MKSSTTTFISYDLRPAKQTERRLLLDFLRCASEAALTNSDYRYVGMGGTMFYDFHLVHRFLGVNNMISLERDPRTYRRSAFNCPFDFITVSNETVASFLARDRDDTVTIYWLDYEDGLGPDIIADITSLATRLKIGGFAFVTVYAEPPGIFEALHSKERLERFQELLGPFAGGFVVADMENSNFPTSVYRVLMASFRNAFSVRDDGVFHPVFQVLYRDSSWMVTVGGYFCSNAAAPEFMRRMRADLPLLARNQLYKMPRGLNLTQRERALFDMAVTKSDLSSDEVKSLQSIGFRKRDFDSYRDLLRFLPRYHESII